MDADQYLHGSSAVEQDRLALMNDILNARCLEAIVPREGESVLEMGAGTGIFARELACAVGPGGRVVAIERDGAQFEAAQEGSRALGNLEFRQGDVFQCPLSEDEWGTFDLVHARFLLEHLQRPEEAVRIMVRAARPGGRIALIDDDHSLMRFWPEPEPAVLELWEAYTDLYGSLGNDAIVGRKLPSFLQRAGAKIERTTQVNYGASAGELGFRAVADNLASVVGGARAAFLDHAGWSAGRFEQALDGFEAWSKQEDATVWYALPMVVGVRD